MLLTRHGMLKSALKSLLGWCGYELRKTSQIGLDPLNDIKQICQKRPLRTIFDVGAHLGETAIVYARQFPQAVVHSFEPSREVFLSLSSNVKPFANVKTVEAALGDKDGEAVLHLHRFAATNSLLPTAPKLGDAQMEQLMEPVGTTKDRLRRLDTYCRENHIGFIDLLKLDTQGFELQVLRGAEEMLGKGSIGLIYTEISFETYYQGQAFFQDLYPALLGHGFQLVDLYGQSRAATHQIRWCDALFLNAAALRK